MIIRILDTETTGTEPADHVVEIAAWDLTIDGSGVPLVAFVGETFVRPPVPIPAVASAVHHIIDEDVANAPDWKDAVQRFIDPRVDGYAAHNAKFDRQWLTAEVMGATPWVCTYRCALRVWPHAPSHSNQALRYWLKPDHLERALAREAHRARVDAYVTSHLLWLMLGQAPLATLIDWTLQPALLPRVTFGKHRGKPWSEVDPDYLSWIVRQPDMNEDVKFTANHYLQGGRDGR